MARSTRTRIVVAAAVLGIAAATLAGAPAGAVAPPGSASTPQATATGAVSHQIQPRSGQDSRTNCTIDDWASDTSINRGWALQAMVNLIPQGVTVSMLRNSGGRATLNTPEAPAINIGQRTPSMEEVAVTDAKNIWAGSQFETDNFWDYTYGCHTHAPYVVGYGDINAPGVQTWNYDGHRRQSSLTKAQWWAHPRQTGYKGPKGWYTWTCRGTPNGTGGATGRNNTYWARQSSDPGFVGTGDGAGRAPRCRDNVMEDLKFTTRYAISKRGGLEARKDQVKYPRDCSVEGAPVGCWQEIYSGGWLRAWAFQYKIYATALRAHLTSDTSIVIPTNYQDDSNPVSSRPLSWRIVDAKINGGPETPGGGSWPSFHQASFHYYDFRNAVFTKRYDQQDWSQTSPYTVPGGSGQIYTLSGWGTPMGPQSMTFQLVGDSDGTWTWPVNKNTKAELPRPRIQVTLGFDVSNFDNGGSCQDKISGDESNDYTSSNDTTGAHCLEGEVPTLWPLPSDARDLWKRIHDKYTKDAEGKQMLTKPNIATAELKVLNTQCWGSTRFKYDDLSNYKNVPNVGADFTWNLSLSGAFSDFSGTGCN